MVNGPGFRLQLPLVGLRSSDATEKRDRVVVRASGGSIENPTACPALVRFAPSKLHDRREDSGSFFDATEIGRSATPAFRLAFPSLDHSRRLRGCSWTLLRSFRFQGSPWGGSTSTHLRRWTDADKSPPELSLPANGTTVWSNNRCKPPLKYVRDFRAVQFCGIALCAGVRI